MNHQLACGIDATKKLSDERFKRPWPPLIKLEAAVRKKINSLGSEMALDKGGQPCEYGLPYYEDNH